MSGIHHPPNPPILYSFPSQSVLAEALEAFIIKAQKESIDKKGRFTVALSGGSLPKTLSRLKDNPAIKWDKWYTPVCFLTLQCSIPIQASLLRRRACGTP
jgi:6-phosphogluconolactonase